MNFLVIPDKFKDKTQVTMYDEIYQTHNDSFVGLNKIAKFLRKIFFFFFFFGFKKKTSRFGYQKINQIKYEKDIRCSGLVFCIYQ